MFAGALACGAPKTAHDADVPDPVDDRKNEVAAPVDQESSETGHYAGTEKSHDKTAETGSGTGSGKATEAETAPRGNMGTTAPVTTETHSNVPYDKEAVDVVLKRAARQVKANCGAATDGEGKATGPWGKATVTLKLGHNGHSQGATIPPGFDGKPVGKCIERAFAIMTYPPFAGGDTTVDWDVVVDKPANAQ